MAVGFHNATEISCSRQLAGFPDKALSHGQTPEEEVVVNERLSDCNIAVLPPVEHAVSYVVGSPQCDRVRMYTWMNNCAVDVTSVSLSASYNRSVESEREGIQEYRT